MISVITACYNSEKTIRKTFDQMLAQTYDDYEYVVVDGGSTDGTVDVIEEYIPKFQGRMSYQTEKDGGIYDAMNKGIQRCHGDLIGIVNSDDWYEKDTLEKIMKAYDNEKYAVIYGMMRTYVDQKVSAILFYHHDFLPMQMIAHPTCFVTRAAYDDLGVFDDKNYKSSADYELMLRYYNSGKVIFKPVYQILSNFTLGGTSSSALGEIETAKLRYSLGIISRKKYLIKVTKVRLNNLIGNHWNSK